MNQRPFSPDDPRLTAYALDELPLPEREEIEQLLQDDPAARLVVEEIRSAGHFLTAALEHEPVQPMTATVEEFPAVRTRATWRHWLRQPIRFPYAYYWMSGLAAACFAVFFVYWQQNHVLETKRYIEVALPSAPGPGAPAEESRKGAIEMSFAPAKPDAYSPLASMSGAAEKRARQASTGYLNRIAERDMEAPPPAQPLPASAESYDFRQDSDFARVADHPLSTFAVDADTAAYANVRRFLTGGARPPKDAVRIEELVNYFPYSYRAPTGDVPFAASLEVADAPWADGHRLVRVGLKGRTVTDESRPAANLVFLVDVSGSMQQDNKLPLVKQSLRMLVEKLRADDRVAIAVYAGSSGMALPSTPGNRKGEILAAIDRLEAGGSTNGAMGIQLAYDLAKANFITGGANRVILATDGDFNVGVTNNGDLVRLIQEKAQGGVFLSVLGFGMGNLKDSTLEQLADKGNGHYAYIDSAAEAKKALVEEAGGTLVTIAKDVKIQVEFNPAEVKSYRLIGYENRQLAKEDFNNDKVDGGEIGAGHTVTALYEVIPAGAKEKEGAPAVDDLKYQTPAAIAANTGKGEGELLTVKVRYKDPAGDESRKVEFPLSDHGERFADASEDFKFAAAVVGFGMVLRDSPHRGNLKLADVAAWARAGLGADAGGYRAEFIGLAERAKMLLE